LLASPFQAPEHAPVHLASRSTTLIRIGIDQLFMHCRRCLTVDMCWPSYLLDLQHAAARVGAGVSIAPIRHKILNEHFDAESVCELVCRFYMANQCDGLFLPVVDHLGVRLPVRQIVDQLRNRGCEIRFVLLDAAQAYSHVSLAEDSKIADMIVAGTHKWLGSYFPLGVAITPNPYSSASIENDITQSLLGPVLDNSLLAFV
jgi:selenocysteine lyase/cysteine desulfurase